jgi:hypothetical protein
VILMNEYIPRIIDKKLERKMKLYGAIVIVGPKWCGKSTTCMQFAQASISFQNPDEYENNKMIAETQPSLFLKNKKPLLIDEWQVFPTIWDSIRYDVDKTGNKGEYLLTGSATPTDKKPMHSGTGRIVSLVMRPMSLYESGESNGSVSLKELFKRNDNIEGISDLSIEDYAFLLTRGGWPESTKVDKEICFDYAKDYINSIASTDMKSIDKVNKNPIKIKSLLKSLARNVSSTASLATIREDIRTSEEDVTEKTIRDYINTLERLFVIDDVEAWSPKLRSKATIRSSRKHEFVDPSLAMASLGATDQDLLKDFNTFGFMFEALCIRDLKIYADSLEGNVYYYRDNNDLECDAIIHLDNGKWGAIEVKLGGNEAQEEAAKNLLKIKSIVDEKEMGSPSFLMILTGTKYAFKRKDGVLVVPLGCLKD